MPVQRPQFGLTALLTLVSLSLGGCTNLAFWTANARATFSHYQAHHDLRYGTGGRNRLDIYQPIDTSSAEASAPHPVVVFVHGGGWNSGSKEQYRFVGAALAEAGMTVVIPDYSLYPTSKFPAFMDDIAQSIVWTAQHASQYGGDASRMYLVGHSAGAHIATLVTLDQSYLRAAGSSATVIKGVVGLAGPYDFYPFKFDYMNDLFGAPAPDHIARSQPINFARADSPPMLLLQGLKDTTVEPRNADHLARALRVLGAPVQEFYFSEATHGDLVAAFSPLARQRAPVLDAVLGFINQAEMPTCAPQARKSIRCSVGTQ